jgi:hypothetical protein
LRGCVALFAEPLCERFRRHLATSAVEQDGDRGGTPLLPIEPFEQGIFGAKGLLLKAREWSAALEIYRYELIEGIARRGFGSDVRENDLHGSDDTRASAGEFVREECARL